MAKGNTANLGGGKVKGGSRFPLYGLATARDWITKLVSKTHIEPQPQGVVFSGVVGSKGPTGEIKISALKQFGLIEGEKTSYNATDLARKINSAPDDEVVSLLRQAALKPPIFKQIFDTFIDDSVSPQKLRQRAADLGVHPDKTESCISIYVQTLEHAKLVSTEGDLIAHISVAEMNSAQEFAKSTSAKDGAPDEMGDDQPSTRDKDEEEDFGAGRPNSRQGSGRAVIHVNVNLDSSLDTDKLAKQLQLLRSYGAL